MALPPIVDSLTTHRPVGTLASLVSARTDHRVSVELAPTKHLHIDLNGGRSRDDGKPVFSLMRLPASKLEMTLEPQASKPATAAYLHAEIERINAWFQEQDDCTTYAVQPARHGFHIAPVRVWKGRCSDYVSPLGKLVGYPPIVSAPAFEKAVESVGLEVSFQVGLPSTAVHGDSVGGLLTSLLEVRANLLFSIEDGTVSLHTRGVGIPFDPAGYPHHSTHRSRAYRIEHGLE